MSPTSAAVGADSPVSALVQAVADSTGDIGTARSMPPACYTSPAFYEFERGAIFRRSWIYACHESQLPQPGDRLSLTIDDEPLLITRDEAGRIHALAAVCQHRGYVLGDDCTTGRHLRCPYHSWTYALDGRLLSAPDMDPAYDLETLRGTVRLPAIRHETWHGMIFVNLDAGAGPLAPTLSRLEPEIGPYGVGRMKVADMVSLSGLPFNWKNMQENALEEYHTTYVHRGYHDNAPANRVVHGDFHSGDGGISRRVGLIIKGGEEVRGRPNFPLIPGLPDEQRGHFLFLAVPPALFLVVRPDGIKLFRILPQAADRMTLTISFLFPPGTIEQRDFPALMERQREFIQLLDQPDIESNTRVFRGLRSSYAPRGPYGPQERSLPQFNQWLLERYRSFLDAGGV